MTDPSALADATTFAVEATAVAQTLLVPIGSTEQHGPHLPLDTDTRVALALARGAAALLGDRALVGPAVGYGASGEHSGFVGTLSIGTEVLTAVLVELGRSADAFAGVVFVNGHGGNTEAIDRAVTTLRSESRRVSAWSWSVPGADAHAGRAETSLVLTIDPTVVRLDLAEPGRTEPIAALIDDLRSTGVRAVSPNGVLGDPTGASATEGESMMVRLVDELVDVVDRSAVPGPPN